MKERDWLNQEPLFACSSCADEFSYHESDLAVYEGRTYCENCWGEECYYETDIFWSELPKFTSGWEKQRDLHVYDAH